MYQLRYLSALTRAIVRGTLRVVTTSEGDRNPDWQQDQVERIGAAIRHYRGDRSSQWVSDRTAELGHRVGRTTITDMEIGRRKYAAVHEVSMIALALGVTPAHLLTFGDMPRGWVVIGPDRAVRGDMAAEWWGGKTVPTVIPPARGLDVHPEAELTALARRLSDLDRLLLAAMSSVLGDSPATSATLRDLRAQRARVIEQLSELGGNMGESNGDGEG